MAAASTSAARPGPSTTVVLALAAAAAALVAMFGEKDGFSATTVACALVGLVPWALVVSGVSVPPALFTLLALPPGLAIVVVADNSGGMFPLMMLLVWLARSPRSLIPTIVTATTTVVAITMLTMEKGVDESGIIYFLAGLGIAWMSGAMLHRQENLTAQLRSMRDVQVEQLAATERARIAREVHDVVAHSLTIVMLNLTGARRALATQPERADEALARAEVVGRDSLDSIRQVMGQLRGAGGGTTLPQPTLAGIRALVDGARGAGLHLDVSMSIADVAVDPTVELVAYRVVQEALANVLQHAPGAASTLDVDVTGGRLVVAVANAAPARPVAGPSGRRGLGTLGMAERTRAVGGSIESGPTADGGWRVVARLPMLDADALDRDALAVVADGPPDEVTWLTSTEPHAH